MSEHESTSLPAKLEESAPAPATEIKGTEAGGTGWRVFIDYDSWYLAVESRQPEALTVAEAVKRVGRYGRAPVFKATRKYVAWIGEQLSKDAWISPIDDSVQRPPGTDPKVPSGHIADAGRIIEKLGRELEEAEEAPPA